MLFAVQNLLKKMTSESVGDCAVENRRLDTMQMAVWNDAVKGVTTAPSTQSFAFPERRQTKRAGCASYAVNGVRTVAQS